MRYIHYVVVVGLGFIYVLGRIPPTGFLNVWVVYFIIPFALLINLVLLFIFLVRWKKLTWLYFATLLIGWNYLVGTVGIKRFFRLETRAQNPVFSVLNYNVSALNTPTDIHQNAEDKIQQLRHWMTTCPADIQCFQEFAFDSMRAQDRELIESYAQRGYHYHFSGRKLDGRLGVITFSRFPIVSGGDVVKSMKGYNRVSYVDVKVGSDTVRVINVHLQSMELKKFHPGFSADMKDRQRNVVTVLRRLRSGIFRREKQFDELIRFAGQSPHPVICAGDFNELPYSYAYQRFRNFLKNTFEEKGRGFGFTYNGNTLDILRIDNQFYSSRIRAIEFSVVDSVQYTDHFPLWGKYTVIKP